MKKLNNRAEKALSGLEIAMREVNANERKEGEFTTDDFILELAADGQLLTYNAAEKRLKRMAEKNLLKYRLIPIKGYHTRVYSRH
jgi:hypothetical protein